MESMNTRLTSGKPAGALLIQTPAELVVDAMVDTVRELVTLQSVHGESDRLVGEPVSSKAELQLMELKAFTLCRTVEEIGEEDQGSKDAVLNVIRHRIYTLYTEGARSTRVAFVVKKIQTMIESELCVPTLFGLFGLCVSNNPVQNAVTHSVNVFELYQLGEKERVKQAIAHSKALQATDRKRTKGDLSDRLVNALYAAKARQRSSQLFSVWRQYASRRHRLRLILRHVQATATLKRLGWAFTRLALATGWVHPEQVDIHLDLSASPPPRAPMENLRLNSNKPVERRAMRGKTRASSGDKLSKASPHKQRPSYGRQLPWEK